MVINIDYHCHHYGHLTCVRVDAWSSKVHRIMFLLLLFAHFINYEYSKNRGMKLVLCMELVKFSLFGLWD